jgi:hypothetical protein
MAMGDQNPPLYPFIPNIPPDKLPAVPSFDEVKNLMMRGPMPWETDKRYRYSMERDRKIAEAQSKFSQLVAQMGLPADEAARWMREFSNDMGNVSVAREPNQLSPSTMLSLRAKDLFLKRVAGLKNEMKLKQEDYLHCAVYQERVFMFYLLSGKSGVVDEPIDLFPSDTLVTQFRLILL